MSKRSLADLLGPAATPEPEPVPADPPAPEPAAAPPAPTGGQAPQPREDVPPVEATPAAPRPSAAKRGRPRTQDADVLVLWTSQSLRARMRAQREKGIRYADQILDALEEAHRSGALRELGAAAAPAVVKPEGALFERLETKPASSEPKVQVTVRGLLRSQRDTIFHLADEHGLSVSEMVCGALDRALPVRPRAIR